MKLCRRCGKQYPDTTAVCSVCVSILEYVSPRSEGEDDTDETTVVQPRPLALSGRADGAGRASAVSFNPWRIIVPSLVALLVVFGAVFLLTRSSSRTPPPNVNQTGLSVDPNAQAVQPAGPPTGDSERGILASPSSTPPNANANVNANVNSEFPGTNANVAANVNANPTPANKNVNQARELPSPKALPSAVPAAPSPIAAKPSPEPPRPKPSP